MVKKAVLEIDCNDTDVPFDGSDGLTVQDLLDQNDTLMKTLTKYKNRITPYYNNKTWDKYKKLSNEYELIFTTPNIKSNISLHNPVSRSFFKMWEMLNDFESDILKDKNTPMKCLFLAEGPGGFVEAVLKYRKNDNDLYYGMTLKPQNKTVPEWKLKRFDMSRIKTFYGADNTGDLYNLDNTHYLSQELGANSMDLITADGGFDFSSDFNNQEDLSTKLIRCETFCAFNLLAESGTYILKIYDIFSTQTLHIFKLLKQCFQKIYIIKPFTSRPANSEKYLVCCGYSVSSGQEIIPSLNDLIKSKKRYIDICKTQNIDIDLPLLHKIVMYNMYYTSRQIFYIQRTINLINLLQSKQECASTHGLYNNIISYNILKCKKWCKKYNIPHETD